MNWGVELISLFLFFSYSLSLRKMCLILFHSVQLLFLRLKVKYNRSNLLWCSIVLRVVLINLQGSIHLQS